MRLKGTALSNRSGSRTCVAFSVRLESGRTASTASSCCSKRDVGILRSHGRFAGSWPSEQNHNGVCPVILGSKPRCSNGRLHSSRFTTASMSVSSMDEYSEDRDYSRLGFAKSKELQEPSYELWTLSTERSLAESHSLELVSEQTVCSGLQGLKEVYVILFGIGKRESEGIYSLRVGSDNGLPQETIVAFESKDDADRYAVLLEAAMYFMPNVCSISWDKLIRFCSDSGYNCRFEPKGSLLRPPCYTVGVTDWEKSLRLRAGYWSVLEEEPRRLGGCTHDDDSYFHTESSTPYMHLTAEELETIKAKLETLLPPE